MKLERLFITCGGTGGHFYPGLAVAAAFQQRSGRVKLLLSGVNSEKQSTIAAGVGVGSAVFPKMPHPAGIKSAFLFFRGLIGGFFSACREFREFRPQALLAMGSFASLPAVLAALLCRVPVILHDGNSRIGKANRWISFVARLVGVAFPAVNEKKCHAPVIECGMPLRQALIDKRKISKEAALAELNDIFGTGFRPERFTYLITGGSQGAASLNSNIPAALLKMAEKDSFQVLHLTGNGKLADTEALYKDAGFPVLAIESSERMELFFGAADLVFSRSGGSTVAELSLFGVPAVLVPFPYAAEGHQSDNARYFAGNGAGVMLNDRELTPERVLEVLQTPAEDWHKCAERSAALARPQATEDLLDLIESQL